MSCIASIRGREILDSRGNPTVEAKVTTVSGVVAIASAPSGASTGRHEAIELRDLHKQRYLGKGVLEAVRNVNEKISSVLVGRSCINQREIDMIMCEADKSQNFSLLGANATTAVSMACAKAAAEVEGLSLYQHISKLISGNANPSTPLPLMNIVNGGKHAGNGIAIQEFMIAPFRTTSISESIRIGSEIYHQLGIILSSNLGKSATNVGDEGGYSPTVSSVEIILKFITNAVKECGYAMGNDIILGIDCAASNFWNELTNKYEIDGKGYSSDELFEYYRLLCDQYDIRVIEDPFREDDSLSYSEMTSILGHKTCIVGDDIFVTNKDRVVKGIERSEANSVIIKVNQAGTLTGAMEALTTASSAGWGIIASHRSGETNDDWLADFSVGINADAMKAGAPARGERVVKYNRLMAMEQTNGESSQPKMNFKSDTILKKLSIIN